MGEHASGPRGAVPWRDAQERRSLRQEAGGAPLLGIEASLADAAGAAAFVAAAAGQLGVVESQWTSPEAIAGVIAFLLSSDSAPTTGALAPVDAPA